MCSKETELKLFEIVNHAKELGYQVNVIPNYFPTIVLSVDHFFNCAITFSDICEPCFLNVTSIQEESPLQKTKVRAMMILTTFLSRVLDYFINANLPEPPVFSFLMYLKHYQNITNATCSKCHKLLDIDETNDIQPPLLRSLDGQPYHIKCMDEFDLKTQTFKPASC